MEAIFKRTYYNCDKKGDRKTDWKSTSSNVGATGKGNFKGTCNYCNKPGHREDTSWSKPGNEHMQTAKYGGRVVRMRNKRKRNGKVEPRNETDKSRKREAVT